MPLAFPLYYFPTTPWLAAALQQTTLHYDLGIIYRKQRFFSRTPILTAQGVLALTVSIGRRHTYAPMQEKEVVFYENWVRQHLRSIEMAYRKAPFFEHYFPECESLLQSPPTSLWQLNLATTQWLLQSFGWKGEMKPAGHLESASVVNLHHQFDPTLQVLPAWFTPKEYRQLYGNFQPGLSGLDLLMNEGPVGRLVLLDSWKEAGAFQL